MRVVLDTNILVSALISPTGHPAAIYDAWVDDRFTLVTCVEQMEELRATLRKPRIAELIKPYEAGRLVNQVKELAEHIRSLRQVTRSPDPMDDYLLALSDAGNADYLVTRDKGGLLALRPAQRDADRLGGRFCGVVGVTCGWGRDLTHTEFTPFEHADARTSFLGSRRRPASPDLNIRQRS